MSAEAPIAQCSMLANLPVCSCVERSLSLGFDGFTEAVSLTSSLRVSALESETAVSVDFAIGSDAVVLDGGSAEADAPFCSGSVLGSTILSRGDFERFPSRRELTLRSDETPRPLRFRISPVSSRCLFGMDQQHCISLWLPSVVCVALLHLRAPGAEAGEHGPRHLHILKGGGESVHENPVVLIGA